MSPPNGALRPRLSLCMIVRDNARTLDACLASIAPHVDEIIVVDTGSLDETPEIARRYGAKVHSFAWVDDFSAARNESLRHARGDWIFWMDSDDTIDEANGKRLRELAYSASPTGLLGYVMQVHCPGPQNGRARELTCVDHVKLIRNHPAIRFEHRIHEQILGAIRRLGGQVAWTDIFVVHSGSEHSPESKQRKYDRDLRHLHLDLAERPDHPFVLFNLGMTYDDMGAHEEAVKWLHRCLGVSHAEESHVRKAYALLVNSLTELGRIPEAREACLQGLQHFENDLELRFREGVLLHKLGQLLPAVEAYRRVLEVREARHFTSVDPSIGSYKARHNLALVYDDLGRSDLAELQWRQAIEANEAFLPAYRGLFGALIKQRRFTSCEALIQNWSPAIQTVMNLPLLRAELCAARGELEAARQNYAAVVAAHSEDPEVLQSACQFYFHHGEPRDAEGLLRQWVRSRPMDAAAHFNLALLYYQLGDSAQSLEQVKVALQLFPNYPAALALQSHLEGSS